MEMGYIIIALCLAGSWGLSSDQSRPHQAPRELPVQWGDRYQTSRDAQGPVRAKEVLAKLSPGAHSDRAGRVCLGALHSPRQLFVA